MTIKEKRKAWLDSHLKIYLDDPSKRSFKLINNKNSCAYRGDNNTKCIIGQDIPDELYSEALEKYSVNSKTILNVLPKSTLELGKNFLNDCQYLHDKNFLWNKNELSIKGQINYDNIIELYCK